jgi:tetratricopeptide (TPR) repeat protein
MLREEFELKWEKDEKSSLIEQVERQYDEAHWTKAVQLYEEAMNVQPDNPEYLHRYGYLLEMKANQLLRQAAKCYQQGLESPQSQAQGSYAWIADKLHVQLIRVRGQLFENSTSIEFYKQQLHDSPDDPRFYCFLARCYLNVDQTYEAGQVIEAGKKLFPGHAMLAYYDGEVQSRLGEVDAALQSWEKSAVLDPQLIDGRFSRAYLLERERRLQECAQEWRLIAGFMTKFNLNDDFPKRELKRIEKQLIK